MELKGSGGWVRVGLKEAAELGSEGPYPQSRWSPKGTFTEAQLHFLTNSSKRNQPRSLGESGVSGENLLALKCPHEREWERGIVK